MENKKNKEKKIYIGHFYGYDETIREKTGYSHSVEIKDESLESIVNTILKTGLNVMVLQQYKDVVVVYISKDRFTQR